MLKSRLKYSDISFAEPRDEWQKFKGTESIMPGLQNSRDLKGVSRGAHKDCVSSLKICVLLIRAGFYLGRNQGNKSTSDFYFPT